MDNKEKEENKVLEFPKHKIVREIPQEVLEERHKKSEKKFADAVVDDIGSSIVTELDNYNFELDEEQFNKDFVFLQDALRATIYRQCGIDHHLHKYIDNNIKLVALTEEQSALSSEKFQKRLETFMKGIEGENLEVENIAET